MQDITDDTDSYGWDGYIYTECDRCHHETLCCSVDFNDGSLDWHYCRRCWRILSERGAFDGIWV